MKSNLQKWYYKFPLNYIQIVQANYNPNPALLKIKQEKKKDLKKEVSFCLPNVCSIKKNIYLANIIK